MNLPVTSPAAIGLPPRPTPSKWKLKPLLLPTMYDLPSEDPEEPGLPDIFHGLQPQLLDETLWLPQYPDDQIFMRLISICIMTRIIPIGISVRIGFCVSAFRLCIRA